MMQQSPFSASLLAIMVFLTGIVLGCHRTPRPEGLPELHLVTLTVFQDGLPLVGADVMLYPLDTTGAWTHGSRTDDNGKARIVTHGQFVGVPEGKFKVTISKNLVVEPEAENPPSGMPGSQGTRNRVFDLVDLAYKTRETTPLELEVKKGKTIKDFDVGKPVRIEMKFP